MFSLHLKFHATAQDVLFLSRDEAEAALAALKPKLGDKYGRNDEMTHTVPGMHGDCVVVLSKIESAAIIDLAKNYADHIAIRRSVDDAEIDHAARKAAAVAAATTRATDTAIPTQD